MPRGAAGHKRKRNVRSTKYRQDAGSSSEDEWTGDAVNAQTGHPDWRRAEQERLEASREDEEGDEEVFRDAFHADEPVYGQTDSDRQLHPSLFPQAYEATIIKDARMAREMEQPRHVDEKTGRATGYLIPWRGKDGRGNDAEIWTDRFDALHLLDSQPANSITPSVLSIPNPQPSTQRSHDAVSPVSSTGWSDLPSDAEDTFFMEEEELDMYKREKKRRQLDDLRMKRMEAIDLEGRRKEEEEQTTRRKREEEENNLDKDQFDLMKRTAKAFRKASNPSLLEMKVLANHGSDHRFAFLRKGKEKRFGEIWERLKRAGGDEVEWKDIVAREEEGNDKKGKEIEERRGLLTGYDSDSESDEQGCEARLIAEDPTQTLSPVSKGLTHDEGLKAEKKKHRLEKARAWSRKRQEEKEKEMLQSNV